MMSWLAFQSTHPCGVRHFIDGCFGTPDQMFQSTHPCGVRQATLVRGSSLILCFNPRTPAGCDPIVLHDFSYLWKFQSTHPCGVRQTNWNWKKFKEGVSIHAPLRGATNSFQSVLPEFPGFQSTHPCGVRQLLGTELFQASLRFNPRTPAGCDLLRCRT